MVSRESLERLWEAGIINVEQQTVSVEFLEGYLRGFLSLAKEAGLDKEFFDLTVQLADCLRDQRNAKK